MNALNRLRIMMFAYGTQPMLPWPGSPGENDGQMTMEYHGLPWSTMVVHGHTTMVIHG